MYEAYFGAVLCGRARLPAWSHAADMVGTETEQPASGALARTGSLA
ncbi:MAG TPA: hypothetical protein VEV63_18985 [Streptosporangiaceae bacterium]|nr:hypothetical protein [Streptosporangiaceae bacterium]